MLTLNNIERAELVRFLLTYGEDWTPESTDEVGLLKKDYRNTLLHPLVGPKAFIIDWGHKDRYGNEAVKIKLSPEALEALKDDK